MHAEVLAIGDEIMSGLILDTNSQWLCRRLAELGIRVLYHAGAADDEDALAEVFRQAIARADVVVATGGLGPTSDDVTREGLAKAVGRKLVVNEEALQHVREVFTRRKREMPKRNEKQACFPEGAQMVHNPNGTAPGIDLEVPRTGRGPCKLIALPGVPAEMKEMWYDSVAARLRKFGAGGRIIRFKQINCFGAGESQMEAMLPEGFLRQHKPPIIINANQATIVFRIAAEGATEEHCHAAMEPIIATIRRCLGTLVFGEDDEELEHAVVRLLRQQQQTLAVAEWGTAGLLAQWLGSVPEAEGFFLAGVTAPSVAAQQKAFGVDGALLGRSQSGREFFQAVADACRQRFAADFALAVGSFPQRDPNATEPKPVCFALAGPAGTKIKEIPFAGHPALLKTYCAKQALNFLRLTLLEKA